MINLFIFDTINNIKKAYNESKDIQHNIQHTLHYIISFFFNKLKKMNVCQHTHDIHITYFLIIVFSKINSIPKIGDKI